MIAVKDTKQNKTLGMVLFILLTDSKIVSSVLFSKIERYYVPTTRFLPDIFSDPKAWEHT